MTPTFLFFGLENDVFKWFLSLIISKPLYTVLSEYLLNKIQSFGIDKIAEGY